jgi:hypothetical protein
LVLQDDFLMALNSPITALTDSVLQRLSWAGYQHPVMSREDPDSSILGNVLLLVDAYLRASAKLNTNKTLGLYKNHVVLMDAFQTLWSDELGHGPATQ